LGLLATGTPWSNEVFWSVIAAILGGYILQRMIEAERAGASAEMATVN